MKNEIVLFTDGDINLEVESRPEEKDIMVNLVMNFLTM